MQALTTKKQAEIAERTKALQGAQQKLQTGGGVMSEQARGQLEKDIERQNKELERFQQDAQAELNELQQELQAEFQTRSCSRSSISCRTRRGCTCCSAAPTPASSGPRPAST